MRGCGEAFRAHLVNYADDFVILSRGHAHEALQWTTAVMTRIGLRINEAKTSVKDVRTESFDFLGYTFGPKYGCRDGGRKYLGASPSRKSVQRIKTRIGNLLVPGNKGSWPQIQRQLNSLLVGCRPTSATEPSPRPIGRSIVTSASASGASSPSGTRSTDAEPADSP